MILSSSPIIRRQQFENKYFPPKLIRPEVNYIVALTFLLLSQFSLADQRAKISNSAISYLFNRSTITAVYRDHNGFLWIGTEQGLYNYDGAELREFNSEHQNSNWIPSSSIRAIDEGRDGDLIIATFGGGLLKWDRVARNFEPILMDGPPSENIITQLILSDSNLAWIGTKTQLSGYDLQLSRTISWLTEHQLYKEIGQPNAVALDKVENIIASSKSGLYQISPKTKEIIRLAIDNPANLNYEEINALEFDTGNKLYIGTRSGHLFCLDLIRGRVLSHRKVDPEFSSSISVLLFHNGLLWIGTNHGLSVTDAALSSIKTFTESNSEISNEQITSLDKDQDLIWVGTAQGLNIVSFSPFETFNQKNSKIFNDVLSFEQDHKGRIWVGTYDGVYLFDQSNNSHFRIDSEANWPEVYDQRVMTMAAKGTQLWLGFRHGGIQVIDTAEIIDITPDWPEIAKLAVTKILHTGNDETWIATYDNGLFRIKANHLESFVSNNSLAETSVTLLLELPNGDLLLGAENTILQYSRETNQFSALGLHFGGPVKPPLILSMARNAQGDIWIGTKDYGLFRWPEKSRLEGKLTLHQAKGSPEISSATIYGIAFDSTGNIWCSTQAGLIKFNSSGRFLAKFTITDGLQGNDFNFGASFIDRSGKVYFGGINGYNRFDPEDVLIDLTPAKIILMDIDFSGKEKSKLFDASKLTDLQLTHKNYLVTFTFSVLDFLDPDKNQFRYKLENFDPEWIENGTRNTATYTNLPAGDYVFRVQGANASGVWNREGISLNVKVLPPYWKTWWAYCAYALALLIAGFFVRRVYDSYSIERRAAEMVRVMHEAEERADDDMQEQLEYQDELVKSAYRHNTATLALINDCISCQNDYLPDELAREANENNMRRISSLAMLEDCLYFKNDGLLADLNKYTDILTARLLRSSPVSQESITTINETSKKLFPVELASPLSIVIYELLDNCIQHAFEADSPANYIHIIFNIAADSQEKGSYSLIVRDSGIGIPGNLPLDTPETSGLAIVRAIVKRLSATLHISSEKGTIVSLEIPRQIIESREDATL